MEDEVDKCEIGGGAGIGVISALAALIALASFIPTLPNEAFLVWLG